MGWGQSSPPTHKRVRNMVAYIRFVSRINEWVGKIFCFLMIPITLITSYEVIMRYIVKRPTIWAWDLNIQLFAALTMLGGGYALLHNAHVSVDVFVQSMTPKKRALLDLITSFFFFLGCAVLLIGGGEMAWASWTSRELMPTIWAPPYYTMRVMIPVGTFFLFLQGIAVFLKNLMIVLDKNQEV